MRCFFFVFFFLQICNEKECLGAGPIDIEPSESPGPIV